MAQQIDFTQAYGRKSPLASLGEGLNQGIQIGQQQKAYEMQLAQLRQKQQEQNFKDVISSIELMGKMPKSAREGTYTQVVVPTAKKAGIDLPAQYKDEYSTLFDDAYKIVDQLKNKKLDEKDARFGLAQIQIQFAKEGNKEGSSLVESLIGNIKDPQKPMSEGEQARLENVKETRRDRIVTTFNADPRVRKQASMQDFSKNVLNFVASGNPIAANAIPTLMARGSGEVGNLSEADKRPFGGSQAILRRMEQALKQAADGTLTQANAKYLMEVAELFNKSAEQNLDRIALDRSKQYTKSSDLFKSADELFDTLRPGRLDAIRMGANKKERPPLSSFQGGQ